MKRPRKTLLRPCLLMAIVLSLFNSSWILAGEATDGSVVISEFMAVNIGTLTDENGDYSDWIELYNPTDQPRDVRGWYLSDDPGQLDKWVFPSAQVPPHGFLVVFASAKDRRSGELHTNFKLDSRGEFLALMNDRFEVVTRFFPSYPPQFPDISYGFGMDLETRTFVNAESPIRYEVPVNNDDDDAWLLPTFVDNDWSPGSMPLGFDTNLPNAYGQLIATDVREAMDGVNSSIYVRIPFNVSAEDARDFNFFQARLQYDDGLAMWINGDLVANENTFNSVDYNSRARSDRLPEDATAFQEVSPKNFGGFQAGVNALCAQVLNRHSRDPDLFLLCEIDAVRVGSTTTQSSVYLDPRPSWPNESGFANIAARPVSSLPSGVYTDEIEVELSTSDPAAEIRFTIDGTMPTEISTLYTAPLRMTTNTELRSRSFRSGQLGSPTLTSRYVVVAPESRDLSSDLPIVVLSTFGEPLSTGDWTACHLEVFDRNADDGRTRFTDTPHLVTPAGIKVRGSASSSWPKRPYAVEIRDEFGADADFPLLGMPPESDWILWPPYNTDPSLVRNTFAYGISNQIGHYSARTRFCEVYVNLENDALSHDHYVGVYVLLEKIKPARDRLDIAELLPHHDRLPEISGGYILRIDRLDPGDTGFPAGGYTLGFGEPKEDDVTAPQLSWITNYINTFNSALHGGDFSDPAIGYRRYINTESFIHHHLINVLCKNVDALRLSTFLYKDRGGKLEMGPVWDFDLAMDSPDSRDNDPQTMRGTGDATDYFNMHWWQRLFEDPQFRREYNNRWSELRIDAFSNANIEALLDAMADELRESQARNFARWSLGFPHGSWEGEIDHLKRWLTTRANWLDSQFLPVPTMDVNADVNTGEATIVMSVETGAGVSGEIFYTFNGDDPRGLESRPSESALLYDGPFVINENGTVQARFRCGVSWSQMVGKSVIVDIPTLTFSEVHFQPPEPPAASAFSPDDFEFIEVYNYGARTVELGRLSLSRGVLFEFGSGAFEEIAPGDYVVVVANLEAFSQTYDTRGIAIAGEFEGDLRDGGESVALTGDIGDTIQRFVYRDLWYLETAGGGHSLVLLDPENTSVPDMSFKESWRPSDVLGGAPGQRDVPPPEGSQIPGDSNQDARLNLSDAARLAKILFVGDEFGFPCASATANLLLLDVNGDDTIDGSDVVTLLTYLFLEGRPPVQGRACVEIEGCPGVCDL